MADVAESLTAEYELRVPLAIVTSAVTDANRDEPTSGRRVRAQDQPQRLPDEQLRRNQCVLDRCGYAQMSDCAD